MMTSHNVPATTLDGLIGDARWRFALEASKKVLWEWRKGKKSGLLGLSVHSSLPIRCISNSTGFASVIGEELRWFEIKEFEAEIHPDDVGLFATRFAWLLSGNHDRIEVEIRLRSTDDDWIWVAARGRPCDLKGLGSPSQIIGTLSDISEYKHLQMQLHRSEQFALSTIDAISAHVCVLDENGTIKAVNAAWRKFYDENAPTHRNYGIGSNYLNICSTASGPRSDGARAVTDGIRAVIDRRQERFKLEYPCHAPHEQRWFNLVATPFGGPIKGVVLAHENITERKLAELELSNITENAADSIWTSDASGCYVYANPAALRLTGHALAELNKLKFEDLLPARERVRVSEFLAGHTADYAPQTSAWNLLCKDGNETEIELVTQRQPDGGYLAIGHDVSERNRHEAELVELTGRALAANMAKSQFLANMSHEIRTPMNSVLGMAQLLLAPGLNEDERIDYANTIHASGQHLLDLLNDILDLSKVEADRIELELIAFSPLKLTNEIAALFRETARGKGLQLSAECIGLEVTQGFLGDPLRLRQILSNLMSNAIKFTTDGGIHLTIEKLAGDTNRLKFSVRDTGIGIPTEFRDKLFSSFSQVDSTISRRFGGTGLGLAISQRLVNLMGGKIELDCTPDQGSVFFFELSLAAAAKGWAETLQLASSNTPVIQAMENLGARRNVLLVDDLPSNRKVIEIALARQNYTVVSVEDGLAAVEFMTKGKLPLPDIVLMDCQMPVMDGLEATRRIRAWENGREESFHLPIIALTADAYDQDRKQCLAAGMDDFLAKPVNIDLLLATLAKFLGPGEAVTDVLSSARAAEQLAIVVGEATPIWDIAVALDRLEGDYATLCTLIRMLPRQIAEDGPRISDAISELDTTQLRKAAHRLKGGFSVIGANRVVVACQLLETAAKSTALDADRTEAERRALFTDHWNALKSEMQLLEPQLEAFLSQREPA